MEKLVNFFMEAEAYKQLKRLAVERECSVAYLIRGSISSSLGITDERNN